MDQEAATRTALQDRIAAGCNRDLSNAFASWLLRAPERRSEFTSIVMAAARKEGADQHFQTIATLGFAADAGLLSETEVVRLKEALSRLAGRAPVVNGVPLAFTNDPVGLLGVALGAGAVADPATTRRVADWAAQFLKASYDRDRAEDWQRCLFAAADQKLGSPLQLPIPKGISSADVRIALSVAGVIDCAYLQIDQDVADARTLAAQEPTGDIDGERAVLRLATLQWLMRTDTQKRDRTDDNAGTGRPKKRGRPTDISDERKRRALGVKGGKARAQILYDTKYPSAQQVKNVSSILRHYRAKQE